MQSIRNTPFGSMNQAQLSESVAFYLREQIMSGRLKKGEFLRIGAIAEELEISTTPVREGLLLLQVESYVRLMPRRGFVVTGFSKEDLVDLFWAQATVGAELAARAASKMSKAEIEQLKALQASHERAAAEGDETKVGEIGYQFHRAINLAAKAPRLAMLMGNLSKQLPSRFYANIEGQSNGSLEYHPIIIKAMEIGDVDAVRSLMFRHIMGASEYLVATLEKQGLWDPAPVAADVDDNAEDLLQDEKETAKDKVKRRKRA
jgi:DNA-binding GntR family transcriptional regulator